MKRLHVHVAVEEIEQSVRFYSALFGGAPSVQKSDYAKWMLDDPRVNFGISSRGRRASIDHSGIQVEDSAELSEAYGRLKAAERPILEQGATTCCYATSEKAWVQDPSGTALETFLTRSESTIYGEDSAAAPKGESACCTPELGRPPSINPAKIAGA